MLLDKGKEYESLFFHGVLIGIWQALCALCRSSVCVLGIEDLRGLKHLVLMS